jgi:hypothetical protein
MTESARLDGCCELSHVRSRAINAIKLALRLGHTLMLGVLCIVLGGCYSPWKGSTNLVAQSQNLQPVRLEMREIPAVYSHNEKGEISIFLSNIAIESFQSGAVTDGLYFHIDVLWIPKPGSTPMDSAATNATVRLVVVASGEVGVYGGSGYVLPASDPGDDEFGVKLRRSTLSLQEATDGFLDLLTPGEVTGTVLAKRDDASARLLHYAASQFVTNALGKSRFVHAETYSITDQPPTQ